MRLKRITVAVIVAVCSLAVAGCGSPSTPGEPTGPTASTDDPELSAAADTIEPMLEKSFPDSFAGLWLDHAHHAMTVYRRPNQSLDATVRRTIPQVKVAFHDARFALAPMRELAGRIMADQTYWNGQGIAIQSARPLVDGSGVRVGTKAGSAGEAQLIADHYGVDGEITVERVSVTPDTDGFVPDVGQWPPAS